MGLDAPRLWMDDYMVMVHRGIDVTCRACVPCPQKACAEYAGTGARLTSMRAASTEAPSHVP